MEAKINYLKIHLIAIILLGSLKLCISQDTSEISYYITEDNVALRERASKNSVRKSRLNRGDMIKVQEEQFYQEDKVDGIYGFWKSVKYDLDTGYVFNAYISEIEIHKKSTQDFFYVVDTLSHSLGVYQFENENWYTVGVNEVTPTSKANIIVSDSIDRIHHDNHRNMVATSLYLASDIDLNFLFNYEDELSDDTTYNGYDYQLIKDDFLQIRVVGSEDSSLDLNLDSLEGNMYETKQISNLLDINGDGILDVFIKAYNHYEGQQFLYVSQSGTLNYLQIPITFKIFPYEGC